MQTMLRVQAAFWGLFLVPAAALAQAEGAGVGPDRISVWSLIFVAAVFITVALVALLARSNRRRRPPLAR